MSKVFPSAFVQEQYPTEKRIQNPVKILTGFLQNLLTAERALLFSQEASC